MTDVKDITRKARRLETLLDAKFNASRGDLAARLKKVGRRVNGPMRRDILIVIDAAQKAGHPVLARQINHASVQAAYDRARIGLEAIDTKERRVTLTLRTLGVVVFNLIAVFVLVLLVLAWRGYL